MRLGLRAVSATEALLAPEELPRVVLQVAQHFLEVVVERLVHDQRSHGAFAALLTAGWGDRDAANGCKNHTFPTLSREVMAKARPAGAHNPPSVHK